MDLSIQLLIFGRPKISNCILIFGRPSPCFFLFKTEFRRLYSASVVREKTIQFGSIGRTSLCVTFVLN
jgi:hypothetical protein